MPNTPARLSKGALTATSATLFTVPTATTTIVTEIVATNTTAVDKTVTIALGGTTFMPAVGVVANGMTTIGLKQVLLTGELITGFCDVVGINIFISGVNVT